MSILIENTDRSLLNNSIKLKNTNQIPKLTCSICLEEMGLKDCVKSKVCGHKFHRNCITKWVQLRNNCPICRTVIKKTFNIYEMKYKGFYKCQKRILINDNYFYIFKYYHNNNKNSTKNKNKILSDKKTIIKLLNSDNKDYIYHYLLSISKIQFLGTKMIIKIAIDINTNKTYEFYFKNVIDSQNCFKLINDNIRKKKGIAY